MTKIEFIEAIGACVKAHAFSYGIMVHSPIIAQAVLESASGTSELAVNANNYFGLKYKPGRCPSAVGVYAKTGSEQNADGSYTSRSMDWFKFDSMADCVIGYFDFINIPRYANLKGVSDTETYLKNIKADGYATSLKYVENLMTVIEKYNLKRFDSERVNEMQIKQCFLTNNRCYKQGVKITPKGIVVHSTGANNPNLKRYVQPDDGFLGVNTNKNDWNRSNISVCVHAFIGKDKSGNVRAYQTLPWNFRSWGCGSGKNGSYNNSHIQFEICEDALTDASYFNAVFDLAAELCAHLMKLYPAITIENVVSHNESYKKGYASGHADCDHWLNKFGKNMDWFRSLVSEKMGKVTENKNDESNPVASGIPYKVKITADVLNVRAGAGTSYKVNTTVKKNQVYTITEEKSGWGKLKSGAGWICLKYTVKC